MLLRAKRCMSLRVLLVVMIAAPILPTIVLAPVTLMRLGKDWPQLAPLGELVLIGIGARMLGGFVALAAAGWLIHATRAVSQAAAELGKGQSPPRTACGIAEIDAVLRSMARAARSLEQRSEAYQRAEAGRRESEARLRDFVESGSDWYLGNRCEPSVHLALRPYPSFWPRSGDPAWPRPLGTRIICGSRSRQVA